MAARPDVSWSVSAEKRESRGRGQAPFMHGIGLRGAGAGVRMPGMSPIRDSRAPGSRGAENAAFVMVKLVVQNVLHVI